ncbi:ubiquitin carboxyl-terminal hydrolase 25-like isoform X2 [Gigantopelta aegis]|uniref:ubiquitin carboxyl-terminal hydrolase 25-like isoform X2 n=1 Tax=Gigantopelta aegis TaxID=1735272 RepID=UPI001B88822A|nr:ubiquitin carboxyl-terminal hydrolase 25-like isoform X2 [Gigantopelta aegis]
MTVEQSSLSRQDYQPATGDAKTYAQIQEITGIEDAHVINEAIKACTDSHGMFKLEEVVSMLTEDPHSAKKLAKSSGLTNGQHGRDVPDALPGLQSGALNQSGELPRQMAAGPHGEDPSQTAKASQASEAVIHARQPDLTSEVSEGDELQKAIAASLQDTPGILGGQVTREEQDISRILEASLAESKAGTKRKRGELWFVDPLNPHERKRQEGWPVGLKNVGNTCWFSAVIQCLFHIRKFRQLVLNFHLPGETLQSDSSILERRNIRFMHELRRLFALLLASNKKYVDPSKPVDILKEAFSSPSGATDSQQDVSEFQHKLLEWLEDAFKCSSSRPGSPCEATASCSMRTEPDTRNPVVELFYGQFKAEGYNEGKMFTNQETFGQFPLQVNGFLDIHESLEGATAQGEIEAVSSAVTQKSGQELWFSRLPPVLTFELSRFQFNQQLGRPEKIHNKIHFPQVIYMDRYMEINKKITRLRREESKKLKEQLHFLQKKLDKFVCYGSGSKRFPLHEVLSYALEFAQSKPDSVPQDVEMESPKPCASSLSESPVKCCGPPDVTMTSPHIRSPVKRTLPPVAIPCPRHVSDDELHVLENCLHRWRKEVESDVRELQENISQLESKIDLMYSDAAMQKFPYHLHAVLVHEGQAVSGHYWAYIFDTNRNMWLKFNDITVSESCWEELERESIGGYHNASAYCLMYVDRSKLQLPDSNVDRSRVQSGDGRSVKSTDMIPSGSLLDFVMDDNKKFAKEIFDWDSEQARKAAAGGDNEMTMGPENKTAHTTGPHIEYSAQHAQLSLEDTLSAVRLVLQQTAITPDEAVQTAMNNELRRLNDLAGRLSSELLPDDDPRLKHIVLYLIVNCADEVITSLVMLEQFSQMKTLDQEPRSKRLRAAAVEGFCQKTKEINDDNIRASHDAWHRKFHHYRETVYLFVTGLDAFYKERYQEAMPYLHLAWFRNNELISNKTETLGLSKKMTAYFQRICLEKVNALTAEQFESSDVDLAGILTTMNNVIIPIMPALFQSGFAEDTGSAEEMREKWCSFLGQDLSSVKVEKLQDFLSKLFEPSADVRPNYKVRIQIGELSELYNQYRTVMTIARQKHDLDKAR